MTPTCSLSPPSPRERPASLVAARPRGSRTRAPSSIAHRERMGEGEWIVRVGGGGGGGL